jgi:DNA-binding Lrp family transcriptional regulator
MRCSGDEAGTLSPLERKLLDEAQRAFPVCSRPYAELGDRAGCSEQEAYDTVKRLRERGIIRRVGGIFNSAALGYTSELVAMKVPAERVEKVASIVSEYHGVTHNYERECDEYNLWFTITAQTRPELDQVMGDIEKRAGIEDITRLPARRVFKTSVILPIED